MAERAILQCGFRRSFFLRRFDGYARFEGSGLHSQSHVPCHSSPDSVTRSAPSCYQIRDLSAITCESSQATKYRRISYDTSLPSTLLFKG